MPARIIRADGRSVPATRPSDEELAERRAKVKEMAEGGMYQRAIARELGVAQSVVHADLKAAREGQGEEVSAMQTTQPKPARGHPPKPVMGKGQDLDTRWTVRHGVGVMPPTEEIVAAAGLFMARWKPLVETAQTYDASRLLRGMTPEMQDVLEAHLPIVQEYLRKMQNALSQRQLQVVDAQ